MKKLYLAMKKIIYLIAVLLFYPHNSFALPSISGVTGNIVNGQSIIVNGSSFGSNGPTIVIFDEFESGTNGENISTTENSATIGNWVGVYGDCSGIPYRPKYSTSFFRSGLKSAFVDFTVACIEPSINMEKTFTGSNNLYVSFALYIPSGGVVPGGAGALDPNLKTAWVNAHEAEAEYTLQVMLLEDPNRTDGSYWFTYNAGGTPARIEGGYSGPSMTVGAWSRFDHFIKGHATEGLIYGSVINAEHGLIVKTNETGKTLGTGSSFTKINIPGYSRGSSPNGIYYDDVYIATGDGARARIEIGDNAVYADCTSLVLCSPTAWGDTSITATVRKGAFSLGSTAYLFVIDSNGAASAGHEIKFSYGQITIGAGPHSMVIGGGGSTITIAP